MHRLFVAFRPPEAIMDQLLGLMEGLNGLRWQSEDQLHLTLRYIGEVDWHQAEDIALTLHTVNAMAFELTLSGVGSFDKAGKVNALWAGVSPHDRVSGLHKKLDAALVRLGLPPEGRSFVPHITLARMNTAPAGLAAYLAAHGGFASPAFKVDHFALYESHLGKVGATYEEIVRYPLNQ